MGIAPCRKKFGGPCWKQTVFELREFILWIRLLPPGENPTAVRNNNNNNNNNNSFEGHYRVIGELLFLVWYYLDLFNIIEVKYKCDISK
jgi:hypothetical protein